MLSRPLLRTATRTRSATRIATRTRQITNSTRAPILQPSTKRNFKLTPYPPSAEAAPHLQRLTSSPFSHSTSSRSMASAGATSTSNNTTSDATASSTAADPNTSNKNNNNNTNNSSMMQTDPQEPPDPDPETGITTQTLKTALQTSTLNPKYVDIVDMSGGCGQSFGATIVSDAFEGKNALARHRLVNSAVKEQLKLVHAWTARCLTRGQWDGEREREREGDGNGR